jgi:hypothetical protein
MICFEIWVNNQKVCVAGIGDSGVLAAHVTWSQRRPEESSTPKVSGSRQSQTFMLVGWLIRNTFAGRNSLTIWKREMK